MFQTIKGYYNKGKIELEENIKIKKKVPVLVTFLEEGRGESLSAVEGILKRKPVKISPDKVVDLIKRKKVTDEKIGDRFLPKFV